MRSLSVVALTLAFIGICGAESRNDVAKGWFLNCGSGASNNCSSGGRYVAAVDRAVYHSGSASLSIESASGVPPEFGGVMQIARGETYRGKRIRFSADVRTANVRSWAGLWMRVDGAEGHGLAFDNMQTSNRALTGDRSWSRQSVVLEVPDTANAIFFGLVLSGAGKAWLDAARIEIVGPDVPTTNRPASYRPGINKAPGLAVLGEPQNLDFEE